MSALAFIILAIVLAGPVPALLSRASWPMRAPRAAIVLWQSIAVAAVLSAFSAGLAITARLLIPGPAPDWPLWLMSVCVLLLTLLIGALWVLAVVARPYQWWRIALVVGSALAYVVIFALPLAREKFMLDPSNPEVTMLAVAIGLASAGLIEALWWIQGLLLGEPRRVWR